MSEPIEKLTPEQETRLGIIADKWIQIGRNTVTNRTAAEALVPDVYRAGGLEPPKAIEWQESPYHGYLRAKELIDPGQTPYPCYGPHDAHWLAFYEAFLEFGFKECEKLVPLMELAKVAGWFYPFDELCILTPNPIHLNFDEENRLHDPNRKAVEYPNGWGLYVWHGVVIPNNQKHIIENPDSITVKEFEEERNAEVRRVMLERKGNEWYVKESKAQMVHEDRYGQLYKREIPGDETICMVKVKNSTPEFDGSFKDYILRVDPSVKTAHEAVAWTFEETPETYIPLMET